MMTIGPSTDNNGSIALAEVQQRFVRALANRCSEIFELIDHRGDLETLMRGFHSLAGIAGAYGYEEVTELSRKCERLCQAALDQDRNLTHFDRARLIVGLGSIRMHGMTSGTP